MKAQDKEQLEGRCFSREGEELVIRQISAENNYKEGNGVLSSHGHSDSSPPALL